MPNKNDWVSKIWNLWKPLMSRTDTINDKNKAVVTVHNFMESK